METPESFTHNLLPTAVYGDFSPHPLQMTGLPLTIVIGSGHNLVKEGLQSSRSVSPPVSSWPGT